MTKKHYEAIAAIIASTYNNAKLYPTDTIVSPCKVIATTASRLADYFQTDNKNFDRTRFLQACGVETKQWQCGNCGNKFPLLTHSQKCTHCGETVG